MRSGHAPRCDRHADRSTLRLRAHDSGVFVRRVPWRGGDLVDLSGRGLRVVDRRLRPVHRRSALRERGRKSRHLEERPWGSGSLSLSERPGLGEHSGRSSDVRGQPDSACLTDLLPARDRDSAFFKHLRIRYGAIYVHVGVPAHPREPRHSVVRISDHTHTDRARGRGAVHPHRRRLSRCRRLRGVSDRRFGLWRGPWAGGRRSSRPDPVVRPRVRVTHDHEPRPRDRPRDGSHERGRRLTPRDPRFRLLSELDQRRAAARRGGRYLCGRP